MVGKCFLVVTFKIAKYQSIRMFGRWKGEVLAQSALAVRLPNLFSRSRH